MGRPAEKRTKKRLNTEITEITRSARRERVPLWELFGYTPHVFAKSAQAIEKKGDELRTSATKCTKSARAVENKEVRCLRLESRRPRVEEDTKTGRAGTLAVRVGSKVSNGTRLHSSEYHK